MILLQGTSNLLKYELMKDRLKDIKEIELIRPTDLNITIDIKEDGKSVEENAIKKAKAYYEVTHLPVITEDSGLYIDKFKDYEQPGLYVKRVNGKENLTDTEILNYYIDKLNSYGGSSLAHYYTGVCIIDENGNIYSDTITETPFLLTTNMNSTNSIKGGILEPISYDIDSNKYFSERTDEDKEKHYKSLNDKYKILIKKYLLKEEIDYGRNI